MDGSLISVADATSNLLPYLVSIDTATHSIDQGIWLMAGVLVAFAFAYFIVGWFNG